MSRLGDQLRRQWRENWLLLLLVAAIVGGFLVLRTPASAVSSMDEVEALLADGQPTLVEFFSNT